MQQNNVVNNYYSRKDLKHVQPEKFHSVEFFVDELLSLAQFKIRNTKSKPMFILVKDSSEIINHLKVDESINMKYYSSTSPYPIELRTKIEYITKGDQEQYVGHYLVGLKLLPDQENSESST